MSELHERLDRLGLAEYTQRFLDERFDTWKTLSDITEQDLQDLGVKLGHRRKLQRAISEWRRQTKEAVLAESGMDHAQFEVPPNTALAVGANGGHSAGAQTAAGSSVLQTRTKRKYRRHPKPDVNAPERPPSAYVIFSNHVRELLKDQDLSFTEMAKVVGERWQVLPLPDRDEFKSRAGSVKDKYTAELNWYKKTDNYREYQTYLKAFKAKAAGQALENKRTKYDVESSEEPHNHESPPLKRRHSGSSASSVASSASEGPSVPDTYSRMISPKDNASAPSRSPNSKGLHPSFRRTSTASSSTSRPHYGKKYGDHSSKFGPALEEFASDGSRSEAHTTVRYASIGSSSYAPQQQTPSGPPTSGSMYPFGFGSGGQSNMRFNLPYATQNPKSTLETTPGSALSTPFEAMFTSDIPPSRRILPVPVTQSFTTSLGSEFRPPLVGDPGRHVLRHDSSKSSGSVLESVVESPIDALLRASELVRDTETAASSSEMRSPPELSLSKHSSR